MTYLLSLVSVTLLMVACLVLAHESLNTRLDLIEMTLAYEEAHAKLEAFNRTRFGVIDSAYVCYKKEK